MLQIILGLGVNTQYTRQLEARRVKPPKTKEAKQGGDRIPMGNQ